MVYQVTRSAISGEAIQLQLTQQCTAVGSKGMALFEENQTETYPSHQTFF